MLRIVMTGPESSAKTTLCRRLSEQTGALWTPEFSRTWLEHSIQPFDYQQFKLIEKGQNAWIDWYGRQGGELLLIDTDWTVLHIWQAEWINKHPGEVETLVFERRIPDLYLLCRPDIEWAPDPLRENPYDRDRLFAMYRDLLDGLSAPYVIVEGLDEARVEKAIQAISGIRANKLSTYSR